MTRSISSRRGRRLAWSLLAAGIAAGGVLLARVLPITAAQGVTGSGAVIDPSRLKLVFSEEFDTLSVSAHGPGTRWTTHTPWNGDFGDAEFQNPGRDFPFTVENGILRIEARKGSDGKWRSGLLSSVDRNGNGFARQYGYFEMRAKLPTAEGVWPAFWLVGVNWAGRGSSKTTFEIDALEYYGANSPGWFESTVHIWYHDPSGRKYNDGNRNKLPVGTRLDEFHTYGVNVQPDHIAFYFDRAEVWRTKAPPAEMHQPLMLLVNLALGSGYPLDKTPSPSAMYVDYVRVYGE